MKAIEAAAHGIPSEVCACTDVDDVGDPGPDQVVVAIEAAPINPADLLMIQGLYPGVTEFPARLGIEGVGRVTAIGDGVDGVSVGQRVMSLGRTNWAERVLLDAAQAIPVPDDVDVKQLAMLKANPASAYFMLRDFVALGSGDWIIQNAANSAVGRHVVRLARAMGVYTVNVVRRQELIEPLTALGANVVVVDGDDLGERVGEITGGASIRLALDAIGGGATRRLADCMADGGTVVNYGFLSGEPCQVTPDHLILHGLTVKGFWMAPKFGSMDREELRALYAELAGYFADGTLEVPIEATYGIAEAKQALAHAFRESRDGKILLLPNGPVD